MTYNYSPFFVLILATLLGGPIGFGIALALVIYANWRI